MTDTTVTDKRLLRGARTRRAVLDVAVDIASEDDLDQVTFGRLASAVGLTKAGVQAQFKHKEALQLAVVEHAREMFIAFVLDPVRHEPHGAERLHALLDRWVAYATTPLFAGGCFRVANMARFDGRPGAVRDALFRDQRDWVRVLAKELGRAKEAGQTSSDLDVELAAFQLDATLCAVNIALRRGDQDALETLRRTIEGLLP
ncbi:TetR family transcriptional regulator C-terminal domain-containing protein [Nocardioides antri]|uniref:TetR/AcrR family transcriptional regulator n=1 Tax=Nocardioides antri TaxID=2607659 RepID=A0A5B1LYN6_9ACTN|nr:TetR family transcriptional regulator [Nocardioides antri]KAA1425792.1 TetR/AcrR family transcriptional regulator [Nocardioides antri]